LLIIISDWRCAILGMRPRPFRNWKLASTRSKQFGRATTIWIAFATLERGDEALAVFRKIAGARPNDPEAHNDLGLSLLQTGDAPGAIVEFRTAMKFKPEDVGYQTNLGAAFLQKRISLRPHNSSNPR